MPNAENLRPVQSPEEARKRGRNGGVASGESKRQRKKIREALEIFLCSDIETKSGEILSGTDAIALQVFKRALKGDLRAFEIIRDTIGERPTHGVHVETIETNNELAELIECLKVKE